MRAELARYAVEAAVGRLVSFKAAGLVLKGVFKAVVPSAFEHLKRLLNDLRAAPVQFAGAEREQAVLHLLFRRVPGKAQAHRLAEKLFLVGDKVERDLFRAQNVLRGVGAVAAFEQHGVIILTRDIIGETQRIRPEIGHAVFRDRARQDGGHGKERRCLIKIVHYPQIPESFLLFHLILLFLTVFPPFKGVFSYLRVFSSFTILAPQAKTSAGASSMSI